MRDHFACSLGALPQAAPDLYVPFLGTGENVAPVTPRMGVKLDGMEVPALAFVNVHGYPHLGNAVHEGLRVVALGLGFLVAFCLVFALMPFYTTPGLQDNGE